MAVEDDDDVATFFDETEFAVAGVFTPAGGGATVDCSVIVDEPQEIQGLGFAGIAQANRRIMVRKSELVNPTDGTILVDGVSYRIVDPELDLTRKIWSFALKP